MKTNEIKRRINYTLHVEMKYIKFLDVRIIKFTQNKYCTLVYLRV